jgi:hypothetical protein
MSSGGPDDAVPLLAYREPPAGLSKEWEDVYRALSGEVFVASAFNSHPDVHLRSLDALKSWYDGFCLVKANAQAVMPHLAEEVQWSTITLH